MSANFVLVTRTGNVFADCSNGFVPLWQGLCLVKRYNFRFGSRLDGTGPLHSLVCVVDTALALYGVSIVVRRIGMISTGPVTLSLARYFPTLSL